MTHASPAPRAASLAAASSALRGDALLAAAGQLLPFLEQGAPVPTARLRTVMEAAFGGTHAEGAWDWKLAYDAGEAAQVLFLRKYGAALLRKPPPTALAMIERVAGLLPTHTRRSEMSMALQQFSTPPGLAFVVAVAAGIAPGDLVLEPSAGTGLLAIHAENAGAGLALNELGDTRAALLARLTCSTAEKGGFIMTTPGTIAAGR